MELFSIVLPKQVTSDDEAQSKMLRFRHKKRDAEEAMIGPSWMYTTVYRRYMLIHVDTCGYTELC